MNDSVKRAFHVVEVILAHPFDPLGQFPPPFAQHFDLPVGVGLDDIREDSPQLGLLRGVEGDDLVRRSETMQFRNVEGIRQPSSIRGMVVATDVGEQHDKRPHKKDQRQESSQATHFLQ